MKKDLGHEMFALIEELYPICRSITGPGVRQSLQILQAYLPLSIQAVPSGFQVLDWQVPQEWSIRDAYIKNSQGERIVDFKASNLHVVSYSHPVNKTMTLAELRPHLHSLPEQRDVIPYKTSYYQKTWGFCLSHRQLEALTDDNYEVRIDSSFKQGVLNYGEFYLPGQVEDEVLFSSHICHPSLANDNLSGIALLVYLARALQEKNLHFSYRFLFAPGTIGAITWLAVNEQSLAKIKHGLVVTGVGDKGPLHYKISRQATAQIDRSVMNLLRFQVRYGLLPWEPYGYDERQYCSPGFDLPVGRLSRTPYNQYPEYHTSADNLEFVHAHSLKETLQFCLDLVDVLEQDAYYLNLAPKGEPQLGRRGLYRSLGGAQDSKGLEMALLWVLNLSDGKHSLLDIAERAALPFSLVKHAQRLLSQQDLLQRKEDE